MIAKKKKGYARRLVSLSLTDGQIDSEKARTLLSIFAESPPRHAKQILRFYWHLLQKTNRDSVARVFHSGPLSEGAQTRIDSFLMQAYGRKIPLECIADATLVAGIKVCVGDDVWDASIATRLESLLKQ